MISTVDTFDAAAGGGGGEYPAYHAQSPWTRFLSPYGQGHILIDASQVNGVWNSGKSVEISLKSGKLVNVSGTLDGVAAKLGIKVNKERQ